MVDISTTPDEDYILKEFVLQVLKSETNLSFDGYALQKLSVDKFRDLCGQRLIYKIRTLIPAEDMETATHKVTVEYPDGWWNAVKERYFPVFYLKYSPVRYKTKSETVTFTAYNLYPKFPDVYPDCGYGRQIIIKYVE